MDLLLQQLKKHYDGVYTPVDNHFYLTEEAVKQ